MQVYMQLLYFSLIFLKVSLNYAIKLITNGVVEKCDVFRISRNLFTNKVAGWFKSAPTAIPKKSAFTTHLLNKQYYEMHNYSK